MLTAIKQLCWISVLTVIISGSQVVSEDSARNSLRYTASSSDDGGLTAEGVLDMVSPQTTFPNVPEQCRGVVPAMYGTFRFFGFRLEGTPAADMLNLQSWTEGMDKRAIGGIEWVPWQDGPYYLLAINSPAGLIRRVCTFDAKDNRTSVCTGMDSRDEAVTETLYVTETDEECRAVSFSIITTKTFVVGETAISNMFVDKVQGVVVDYNYPITPFDMPAFTGGAGPVPNEETTAAVVPATEASDEYSIEMEITAAGVLDLVSPATTFPNVPEQCRGIVPAMSGTYRFFGFRLEGTPAADMLNLQSWTEGMDKRAIGGIEWVPWQDGPYYLLAINSPAGLIRRVCTFDAKDNRTSVCTGMDSRDEAVTETLYVTETDEEYRAVSFSIITTKTFVVGETAISNMFVDKVQGVVVDYNYPITPFDMPAFTGESSTPAADPTSDDASRPVLPSEDEADDMTSNNVVEEARVSMEFTRFDDYDGPVTIWETLPEYTEDLDEINGYLRVINALISPVNFRDPDVMDEQVLEDMLSGNIDFAAVINELYEPDAHQFMRDVVYRAGRSPMFPIQQTVMNTTLISLGDQFYTPGASIGDPMAATPVVIPYGFLDSATLTAVTTEFAHTHMNFWMGLDYETGLVDPEFGDPMGNENRFMFLPPYHEDGVPCYMFFYMGEGVYAKIRLWVGADTGWDLSYLGMWPHAFVPNSNYNVFYQAVGGNDEWIAWYDLEDPSAQQVVDFFMARNEMLVSPDFEFVLNRNPWVRLDEITVENNGIEGVVIGE